MVEAVIFDLDGVITDTANFHYLAWKQLGDKIGIEINEEFNESLKGISRMESLERLLEFGEMEDKFTPQEKIEMAIEKNNNYVKLIEKITPKDILLGIKELLTELKSKQIKIGLASASKNAVMVLNNLELMDYFDFIADAAKCKYSKPAPDIFLMAAKGLNVNPINCIGIEDASAGIQSINTANMYSVGVGNEKILNEADYVVSNTQDLKLDKLLNILSKNN
ncbi:MAG: beta-phosphoglucomutase [Peptostreptococcaceae bacterium]